MKEATHSAAEGNTASLSMLTTASIPKPAESLQGRPPRRILWGLIAAALALHVFFLDGLNSGTRRDQTVTASALDVRILPVPAAAAPPSQQLRPTRVPAAATTKTPPANAPARAPLAIATAAPMVEPVPSSLKESETVSIAPVAPLAVDSAAPTPPSEGDVPVYRTRLPPSVRLLYQLRRGALSGSGELLWRLADEGYRLSLEGRLAGLAFIRQNS